MLPQFFIQLTHGHYQSSLRLVCIHDLLRRIGAQVVLRLNCPQWLLLDDVALSLALEEAMSNARKYGDGAKDIVVSAFAAAPTSGGAGSERASTREGANGDELTLEVSVNSVDQIGAHRLTNGEARRAFEHGFKGPASCSMVGAVGSFGAKNPYSDGIGLSAARDAARAAHGSVALVTSEDETGRVHTIFQLQVPCKAVEEPELPPPNSPRSIETTPTCATQPQQAAAAASTASGEMWKSGRRASKPVVTLKASLPKASAPKTDQPTPPRGFYTSLPLQRERPREQVRPLCIVVDDDDMVSDVILHMINSTGLYDTVAFGATLEGQQFMEDIILGLHSRHDPPVKSKRTRWRR